MATENDTAQPVAGAPENPYADEYRRFVEQTKDHVLTVLHEDGLYRHLRMGKPGQGSIWSWNVSTIPFFLSTLGDIADGYSFSREEDMLDFFSYAGKNRRYYSDGAPSIDFRYWAEKLRGGRHSMDVKRYSAEDFLQQVREHLDESEALGVEARHDRAAKISLIKLIHQMRGLDEAASQALFDAHASAQASPNLGTDGLGGGRLGGVHSTTWRRANDALRSALDALWSVDGLSEEQIDELIENHGYHRIGDEDFPAVDPLTKVEEIVADARWHSDDERQAHEWLSDNEEHVGSDTWEWDLRDWDVHFLFTCWAIDLTVEKWREHLASRAEKPLVVSHEGREVEVGIWPAHPELDGNDPEAVVVQIDTGERTGRIRVNLNEAPIWDGDPSTDEQPGSLFHTNPEVQHLLHEKEQQS